VAHKKQKWVIRLKAIQQTLAFKTLQKQQHVCGIPQIQQMRPTTHHFELIDI